MLRDHSSRLNAASLCISAGLDLDTVLSELVESARALTDCESCKRLGNQKFIACRLEARLRQKLLELSSKSVTGPSLVDRILMVSLKTPVWTPIRCCRQRSTKDW